RESVVQSWSPTTAFRWCPGEGCCETMASARHPCKGKSQSGLELLFQPGRLTARKCASSSLFWRGASPGPADGPHLPALASSAEELIAAIGLEPRNAHSGRHLERLQDLSRSRSDSPQIALVTFPGAMPQLSVDPADLSDQALALHCAKNPCCPRLG